MTTKPSNKPGNVRNLPPPKEPPHNLDTEEALIGVALVDWKAGVSHGVRPDMFYKPAHQMIWQAILDDGPTADALTVSALLKSRGFAGDPYSAATLTGYHLNTMPSVSNAARYAHEITNLALRRRVIALAADVSTGAMNDDATMASALRRLRDDELLAGWQGRTAAFTRLQAATVAGNAITDGPGVTWLIHDYLPANAWGIISAPTKKGKSLHTLALSLALACGDRWAGEELDPVPVLYIAAERADLHRSRCQAWSRHHRRPIPDTFHTLTRAVQLHNDEELAALCELVTHLGAKFVVIDTLSKCRIGIDENDNTEGNVAANALDRITEATNGGTVHVVHHTGHSDQRRGRGASSLPSGAHYEWSMTGNLASGIQVRSEGMNAGAVDEHGYWYKAETVHLDDDERGRPRHSAVLVQVDPNKLRQNTKEQHLARIIELLAENTDGMTRAELDDALDCGPDKNHRALDLGQQRNVITKSGNRSDARYYLAPGTRT